MTFLERMNLLARRVSARSIDFAVTLLMSIGLHSAVALYVPMDSYDPVSRYLFVAVVVAMNLHLLIGEGVLPNTFGRFVCGIRVLDEVTGRRPGVWKAIVRVFFLFVWPVELLLMLVDDGRRLGDRAAGTHVVMYSPDRPLRVRLLYVTGMVAFGVFAMWKFPPYMNSRTNVAKAAKAHLLAQGANVKPHPRRVEVDDSSAVVTFRSERATNLHVILEKAGEGWRTKDVQEAAGPDTGFSYSIGKVSSRRYLGR